MVSLIVIKIITKMKNEIVVFFGHVHFRIFCNLFEIFFKLDSINEIVGCILAISTFKGRKLLDCMKKDSKTNWYGFCFFYSDRHSFFDKALFM